MLVLKNWLGAAREVSAAGNIGFNVGFHIYNLLSMTVTYYHH